MVFKAEAKEDGARAGQNPPSAVSVLPGAEGFACP